MNEIFERISKLDEDLSFVRFFLIDELSSLHGELKTSNGEQIIERKEIITEKLDACLNLLQAN